MVAAADPQKPPGEILPGALYRFTEVCRRLGWSTTAARTARRKGLAVKYCGGRAYCAGSEVIRFVLETGKDHK